MGFFDGNGGRRESRRTASTAAPGAASSRRLPARETAPRLRALLALSVLLLAFSAVAGQLLRLGLVGGGP